MTFYHYSMDMDVYTQLTYIASSIFWLGVHVIRKVVICYAGTFVKNSIESLKELVLQLISNASNDSLRNELRCILVQIDCGPKKIENSFFVIDWRLLLMVKYYRQI